MILGSGSTRSILENRRKCFALNHFSRFVEFWPKAIVIVAWGIATGLQTRLIHLAEGHIHIADGGPLILAFSQNLCGGNDFLGLHPRLR